MLDVLRLEESVEYTVDYAEVRFQKCWAALASLQVGTLEDAELVKALVLFQPDMGDALFALSNLKNILAQERRDVITQKARHSYADFKEYLKRLRDLQKVLEAAIDIGRAIGDGYAWIFYRREGELLNRHLAHESVGDPATGVGGKAEVEFVRRMPKFGQYVVLWHGMTSFLRVADISLIHPTESRVVSLAELKARQQGEMLTIRVLAADSQLDPGLLPPSDNVATDGAGKGSDSSFLDSGGMERLKRQIKTIKDVLAKPAAIMNKATEPLGVCYCFDPLIELANALQEKTLAAIRADRGLALIGIRLPEKSLFHRLSKQKHSENLDPCMPVLRSICDRSLEGNQLRASSLAYPVHLRYSLCFWTRPVFWWDLPLEIREALVFRKILVLTWYNPVHLFKEFRDAGLQVQLNGRDVTVLKPGEDGGISIFGLDHLLRLVESELFPDKAVLDFVNRTVEVAQKVEPAKRQRMAVHPHFIFN